MTKNESEPRQFNLRRTMRNGMIVLGGVAVALGGILVGPPAYDSLGRAQQDLATAKVTDLKETGGIDLIEISESNGVIARRRDSGRSFSTREFYEAAMKKVRAVDGCDVGSFAEVQESINYSTVWELVMTKVNCGQK